MKTKLLSAARTLKVLILLVSLSLSAAAYAAPMTVHASGSDCTYSGQNGNGVCQPAGKNNCPGGIHDCNDAYVKQCAQKNDCDIVKKYVNPLIRFLILLVGIAVVAGIIKGGIQYMLSTGEPQQAAKAKEEIRDAIVALLVYIFLYAMLRWLMPGDYFVL